MALTLRVYHEKSDSATIAQHLHDLRRPCAGERLSTRV